MTSFLLMLMLSKVDPAPVPAHYRAAQVQQNRTNRTATNKRHQPKCPPLSVLHKDPKNTVIRFTPSAI